MFNWGIVSKIIFTSALFLLNSYSEFHCNFVMSLNWPLLFHFWVLVISQIKLKINLFLFHSNIDQFYRISFVNLLSLLGGQFLRNKNFDALGLLNKKKKFFRCFTSFFSERWLKQMRECRIYAIQTTKQNWHFFTLHFSFFIHIDFLMSVIFVNMNWIILSRLAKIKTPCGLLIRSSKPKSSFRTTV